MLFDGDKPILSFGVMGGQYQATGHAHFVSQVIDRDFDIQMASDQPRSFFTERAISLEPTIDDAVRAALQHRLAVDRGLPPEAEEFGESDMLD